METKGSTAAKETLKRIEGKQEKPKKDRTGFYIFGGLALIALILFIATR